MSAPAPRLTAILSKRPVPGRVKTRLVPPLEPEEAAALAEAMLADVTLRLVAAGLDPVLFFAPAEPPESADEERWFRAAFPGVRLRPQRGPDLGARLAAAFEEGLGALGARTMVALGSDQPLVPAARLEEGHRALEDGADLVLGPDHGGGYYLVGLRAPRRELFTEVALSTSGTAAATRELAERAGLAVAVLAPDLDVDVAGDLARLAAALESADPEGPGFPRRTAAVLAGLLPLRP